MNGLARYKTQLKACMLSAVQHAAVNAAAHARSIVPVGNGQDGGHLRDCISSHAQMSGGFAEGEVLADNPHATYVEMGTARMAAQPYLRPALKNQRSKFLHMLSDRR